MPSPSPSSARPGAAFRRGFADALPICFGYFAVGFTVALAAVVNGHPLWSPILLSLTHVSGTSQGAIVDHMNLATVHRISEQQNVKIRMLNILVHAALIQVIPGIGFNINTDRFHLSSNPKTGTGFCRRCPPSLLCLFFLFLLFLLTPVMDLRPDPHRQR